ncbi:hypothetical protein N9E03_00095 [bacterium]|nr:hypothetical protein [bacterium]|tara:strand:- start:148 stop:405 length:258 start_codon:yes stop_codon:yes gene_type:complete
MSITFNQDDIAKLKTLIQEGIQVSQEVETLNEGLKDTVKHIAEEMGIKPAIINKAIKVAYKGKLHEVRDDFDQLETILESIGRPD